MKVKYNGESKLLKEWFHRQNGVFIENGRIYKTELYEGINSVVDDYGDWICDCDSETFKEEFEIIEL